MLGIYLDHHVRREVADGLQARGVEHDHQQLAIYRATLRHLLDQAAKFGGEDHLSTPLMHELRGAP
jgi:hypothetical protein